MICTFSQNDSYSYYIWRCSVHDIHVCGPKRVGKCARASPGVATMCVEISGHTRGAISVLPCRRRSYVHLRKSWLWPRESWDLHCGSRRPASTTLPVGTHINTYTNARVPYHSLSRFDLHVSPFKKSLTLDSQQPIRFVCVRLHIYIYA